MQILRSFLQRFLPAAAADELDFFEFSGSMMISTCTPNGHHHSCSSGVVRSGTPWITTAAAFPGEEEVDRRGDRGGMSCNISTVIRHSQIRAQLATVSTLISGHSCVWELREWRWSLLWDLWSLLWDRCRSLFRGTRGRRARLGGRRRRRLGEVGKGRRRLARAGGVSRVVDYESGEARGLELHARVVDAVCAGAKELYSLRRRVLEQNGGCTESPKNCFT